MMTEKPIISGVLETALYVNDLAAANSFYGDLLGLTKIAEVPDRHMFFQVADAVLLLFDPAATQLPTRSNTLPVPNHGAIGEGHVCFRATNSQIDTWKDVFQSQAIEIEADFNWPNGARSLYIRDPSRNSIEFAEPKLWGLDKP